MLFILHKTAQRKSKGKNSKFLVRGQVVEPEVVQKFLRRKKIDLELSDPSTPLHITYSTPSPRDCSLPPRAWEVGENENDSLNPTSLEREDHISTISSSRTCKNTAYAIGKLKKPYYFRDGYALSHISANDIGYSFSPYPEMFRQPLPPLDLLSMEEVFFNIKSFCSTKLSWKMDDRNSWHDFRNYCVTASVFIKKESYTDARRMLSKAFGLVCGFIENGEPRHLDSVIQGLLRLMQSGHDDIVRMLQGYISKMASAINERKKTRRPWVRVYSLIGALDIDHLRYVLLNSWKCMIDAFDRIVGRFDDDNCCNYSGYAKFASGGSPYALRNLILECEQIRGKESFATFNLIYGFGLHLVEIGHYEEAYNVSTELLARTRGIANRNEEHISVEHWALRNMAKAQYFLKNAPLAETHQRLAIAMEIADFGTTDPLVIADCALLESWLRNWGRNDEADRVRMEYKAKVGTDEVDNEMGVA